MGEQVGEGEARIFGEGVINGADERPDLVEHAGGFVEQFADIGSRLVFAGEAEDVVQAAGDLAVIEVLGEVLAHLLFEGIHVVIQGIPGDMLGQLGKKVSESDSR